jgi:hypothetical protein
MKLVFGLALATLLSGCIEGSYMHLSSSGKLAADDAVGFTQSYSECDTAGARERSDPSSPCHLPSRKAD